MAGKVVVLEAVKGVVKEADKAQAAYAAVHPLRWLIFSRKLKALELAEGVAKAQFRVLEETGKVLWAKALKVMVLKVMVLRVRRHKVKALKAVDNKGAVNKVKVLSKVRALKQLARKAVVNRGKVHLVNRRKGAASKAVAKVLLVNSLKVAVNKAVVKVR